MYNVSVSRNPLLTRSTDVRARIVYWAGTKSGTSTIQRDNFSPCHQSDVRQT